MHNNIACFAWLLVKLIFAYSAGFFLLFIYIYITRKIGFYSTATEWSLLVFSSFILVFAYLYLTGFGVFNLIISIALGFCGGLGYYVYSIWVVLLLTGDSL